MYKNFFLINLCQDSMDGTRIELRFTPHNTLDCINVHFSDLCISSIQIRYDTVGMVVVFVHICKRNDQ